MNLWRRYRWWRQKRAYRRAARAHRLLHSSADPTQPEKSMAERMYR